MVCVFPCYNSFYNSKGACQFSCKEPHIQKVQGIEKYCLDPPSSLPKDPSEKNPIIPKTPEIPETLRNPENSSAPGKSGACPEGFDFLYANGSCFSTCVFPFDAMIIEGVVQCLFRCESGLYMNWDGECQARCDFPLKAVSKGVEKYCEFHCDGSYRYENNTCKNSCKLPFIPTVTKHESLCNFACPGGSYLDWNHACRTTCNFPLVKKFKGAERYCELPCKTTEFLYENGTCHDSCEFPYLEIPTKFQKFCNFTCPTSSFMNWNLECQRYCHPPFIQNIVGSERYCEIPCNSSAFVHEDGTCSMTCDAPLISNIRSDHKFCDTSCPTGLIHYWDGTCRDECPSSFQKTIYQEEYCDFHCDKDHFLYEGRTCGKTCTFPHVALFDDEGYKFCNLPCNSFEYLSLDGSCQKKCDKVVKTDSLGVKYCIAGGSCDGYLYADGTCQNSCSAPFVKFSMDKDLALCTSPCGPGFYYHKEMNSCVLQCHPPLKSVKTGNIMICQGEGEALPAAGGDDKNNNKNPNHHQDAEEDGQISQILNQLGERVSTASSYIRPNDLHSVFLMSNAKTTKFARYVNLPFINHHHKRVLTSSESKRVSISSIFSFEMPFGLKEKIESREIPVVFKGKVFHSSYLVNQWEAISTLIVVALVGAFIALIDKFVNKVQILGAVIGRLKTIFYWNFMLLVLFNCYDDIIFFTLLELQTLQLDSGFAVLSLLVCVGMNIFAGFILYKVYEITKEAIRSRRETNKKYQVLYAGFQDNSFLSQGYLLFYIGRVIIGAFLIGTLYNYPLIQTILLTLLSFAMLGYLLKERPMYDRFHVLVIAVFEFVGLIVNLGLLFSAVFSFKNDDDRESNISLQIRLSLMIISCSKGLEVFSNIVLWLYIFLGICSAWKISKLPGAESKTAWLNLLVVPFRTPGMEFIDENLDVEKNSKKLRFGWMNLESKNNNNFRRIGKVGKSKKAGKKIWVGNASHDQLKNYDSIKSNGLDSESQDISIHSPAETNKSK